VSTLRGEKPIFVPLSKNNTGMAALRADLPVITINNCISEKQNDEKQRRELY